MKIGILCAGDREAQPVFEMIEGQQTFHKAMLTFHTGAIESIPVVALFTGVCKVNAAVAAQLLIDVFGCEALINAGTAGGMDERLCILDTVVAEECAYHDVAEGILTGFHPWMESVWFHSDEKLLALARKAAESLPHRTFFGRMVTGEQFIEHDRRDEINRLFAPLSVDMETAAIAHVCHVNSVPFIAVRTITDTAACSGEKAFHENCASAARISAEFVRLMLRLMASEQFTPPAPCTAPTSPDA